MKDKMKVKDILSKLVENYHEIRIETYNSRFGDGMNVLYKLAPHGIGYQDIPEEIAEKEVDMIGLFLDGLSIVVV